MDTFAAAVDAFSNASDEDIECLSLVIEPYKVDTVI